MSEPLSDGKPGDDLDPRTDLSSRSREELVAVVAGLGERRYRAEQLFRWLFARGARSVDEMTDLPAAFRSRLEETFVLRPLVERNRQVSRDGTVKFLFGLPSGRSVESVLIPDFDGDGAARRLTVCVSSQVGCAMGCSFCATGRMGFGENLHAGQIYAQAFELDRIARERFKRGITNVVFMGMGEPLQNYEQVVRSVALLGDPTALGLGVRRITISTVGLASRVRRLADDGVRASLAVSLHAPDDGKRASIMPVGRSAHTGLEPLLEAIDHYRQTTGRRATYEYCMFRDFNDGLDDARNLIRLVRRAPGKVNLIMYNPVPGLGFSRTDEDRLERFIRELVAARITVTVRRSRGEDIDAACGQLASRE